MPRIVGLTNADVDPRRLLWFPTPAGAPIRIARVRFELPHPFHQWSANRCEVCGEHQSKRIHKRPEDGWAPGQIYGYVEGDGHEDATAG